MSRGYSTRYNNINKLIENKLFIDLVMLLILVPGIIKGNMRISFFFVQIVRLSIIYGYNCIVLFLKIFHSWKGSCFILLDLSMSSPYSNQCRFIFEAVWLLQNDFHDFCKDVWLNFIQGSCTYQLIRKLQLLKHSITNWKNDKITKRDKSFSMLLKELDNIQKNLMINPIANYLQMQKKALQDQIQNHSLEQELLLGLKISSKLDSIRRKKY